MCVGSPERRVEEGGSPTGGRWCWSLLQPNSVSGSQIEVKHWLYRRNIAFASLEGGRANYDDA